LSSILFFSGGSIILGKGVQISAQVLVHFVL